MSVPAHKLRQRVALMVVAYCLVVAALALLSGCAPAQPTGFEIGAPVQAPQGCTDGRSRGVDC